MELTEKKLKSLGFRRMVNSTDRHHSFTYWEKDLGNVYIYYDDDNEMFCDIQLDGLVIENEQDFMTIVQLAAKYAAQSDEEE